MRTISRRKGPLILLGLCLLAFALRAYRLDYQSLWVDEAITLSRSQQPLPDLLRNMPAEHAPLYFTLIHVWLPLAGTTDFALRFSSLLFGVMCIPLMGVLGTALFDRRVGLLAALLLAVNPFHVWYAQDARMYTLATAFSLACLAGLVRALQTNRWWHWAIYALSGALALYSHYYAGLILVVSGLFALGWLAWSPADRVRVGRRWLASVAAMGLIFLPWLPHALRVFEFHGWRPPIEAETLIRRYLTIFSLGTSVSDDLGWRLTWGFLALAAVGLIALGVRARRDPAHRPGAGLMLTLIVVTILGGVLLAVRRSDFQERYFMVVTPTYYLAIALGLTALARPRRVPIVAAAGLAFILGISAFSLHNHYTNSRFAKPDYKQVTATIAQSADPENDALVLSGAREAATRRYYPGERPKIYNLEGSRYKDLDEAGQAALLAEIARKHRQVWLLIKHGGPDPARAWFSQHAFPVQGGWTTDIFLSRYATWTGALPPPRSPLSTHETTPARLVGYALASADEQLQVAPGDIVKAVLYWETDAPLDRDYKVSFRLVDDTGHVVAAVDRSPGNGSLPSSSWPPGETVADRQGLLVPTDAPPGEIQLVVKLYDVDTLTDVVGAVLGPVRISGEAEP